MADEWGPLGPLVGDWEAEGGLDTAYSHTLEKVLGTPYLERVTFKPFGPVDNGRQSLYGLDYKTAMWRNDEENPFHTEVGYWLWDGATGEVLRGFVVPRGITVLAGGTASADAKSFTLAASPDHPQYTIGENKYLAEERVDVELRGDDHDQRGRLVDVQRDDHVEDGRDGRALRPHRSQHAPPRRLTEQPSVSLAATSVVALLRLPALRPLLPAMGIDRGVRGVASRCSFPAVRTATKSPLSAALPRVVPSQGVQR